MLRAANIATIINRDTLLGKDMREHKQIKIEYWFANESNRSLASLSQADAIAAIEEFPWDQQLAVFNQDPNAVGPEVRLDRFPEATAENPDAYASITRNDSGNWLIVAGAMMPDRFLGIFPRTKKADIMLDEISWQDLQHVVRRFYQDSVEDLFEWIKKTKV